MIARLVVALVAGAALAIPAGLLLPWMIAVFPGDAVRPLFLDFELQQNLGVGLWLILALLFMILPTGLRWRGLLSGLALLLWAIPVWTLLFAHDVAAREVSSGGGPVIAVAVAGALLGSAALWVRRRSRAQPG